MIAYASLDPALMKRLATRVDQMPPEDRSDLTSRTLGLFRFLDEIDQQGDRASLVISFDARMRALMALRDMPEFGAWWISAGESGNPDLLHEVMIETAATEPLIEGDDWPSFDSSSFLTHALQCVEADGHA